MQDAGPLHKPKSVLIVDDDQGTRETLAAILKRDYRILQQATGEEALAAIADEQVDIVLLDIQLPGVNGLQVLRTIKEKSRLTEVIMISALRDADTIVEAVKRGAYHYITKDLEYDDVRRLVA